MRKLLPFLFIVLSFTTFAHPSIAIVKDSQGNIYYSDLEQVWKVDIETKNKSVYVPNVHTHQLYFDSANNLYGEHLWYEGDATKKFNHYLWKFSPSGKIDTLFGPTQAYINNDYSVAADRSGNQYFFNVITQDRILKKTKTGKLVTLAIGNFKGVPWLQRANDESFFFVKDNTLFSIDSSGNLSTVSRSLANDKATFGYTSAPMVLGVWQDANNSIYFASYSDQAVKKILANGQIESVAKSEGEWGPTSGCFDDKGNLWVLEFSTKNEVRARMIKQSKVSTISTTGDKSSTPYWVVGLTAAIIIMGFIMFKLKQAKA